VDPALAGEPFRAGALVVSARTVPELETLRRLAEGSHVELAAERTRTLIAEALVAETDRERLPTPEFQVAYQPNFRVPLDVGSGSGAYLQLGVQIPLPVWETGAAAVRRAELDAAMQRLRVERLRHEILVRVALQRRLLELRLEGWRSLATDDTTAIERLRALAAVAYREGTLGILELVDAHQSILELVLRRAELDAQAVSAWLDLEGAFGMELFER
jgi:outer membrane protein TolC